MQPESLFGNETQSNHDAPAPRFLYESKISRTPGVLLWVIGRVRLSPSAVPSTKITATSVSAEVREAIGRFHGLYLQAYGGCGALYSARISSAETVAYPELGPEALLRISIHDFPVFCMIDSLGNVFGGKP